MNRKNIFSVLLCLLVLQSLGASDEPIQEKRIKGVMRTIGHELLTNLNDCESRILPIERLKARKLPTYRIPFENEWNIDPETIIFTIHQIVSKSEIAEYYFVEVEECETKKIVHSYEMGINKNINQIACSGRVLPKNCYSLIFTIVDQLYTNGHFNNSLKENHSTGSTFQKSKTTLFYGLLVALLLLAVFIRTFYQRAPKSKEKAHLIKIGASQFDHKQGTLSVKDQNIKLSNKEAELLHLLFSTVNTTVTREVLLQKVWADEGDYIGRTLDVFISKLRKKLEADSSLKIINIRGVGYKLVVNPAN